MPDLTPTHVLRTNIAKKQYEFALIDVSVNSVRFESKPATAMITRPYAHADFTARGVETGRGGDEMFGIS